MLIAMPTSKSHILSGALHIGLLSLFLLLSYGSVRQPPPIPVRRILIIKAPLLDNFLIHGPSHLAGSSNSDESPARRGVVPPQARKAFILPETYPSPKLPLELAVAFEPPKLVASLSQEIGD